MNTLLRLAIPVAAAFAVAAGAHAQEMHDAMPQGAPAMPADTGGMAAMHGGMNTPLPPVAHRIEAPAGAFGITLPDLGVDIIAVRTTAAGGLLDLRYRVLDPVKAKPLMDPRVPLRLIDPGNGTEMEVPMDEQVGALRQSATHLRPGEVLVSLFGNPGRTLKKGDKVNLRVGDLEVVGLTIEG